MTSYEHSGTSVDELPLFTDVPGAVVSLDYQEDPEPEEEEDAAVVSLQIDEDVVSDDVDDDEQEEDPVLAQADDDLISGEVQKYYSSSEVAKKFFGKSTQWLYWGMRTVDADGNPAPVFVHPDGTPIVPLQVGKGKRNRYTLADIKAMALACYRRGNLKEAELKKVLGRIAAADKKKLTAAR